MTEPRDDPVTTSRPPGALAVGDLFPDTAEVTPGGHLAVGGCDLVDLAGEFGTPLYVYDEASIRARARAYRRVLERAYGGATLVCYAAKAYCAPWLLQVIAEEGLGLDVVSGGELHAATLVDFPRDRIYFHGNNKSRAELEFALDERVGRIVVDNLDEIALLGRLATERGRRQAVLLRVGPGVDAHTHAHLTTGAPDTKFGLGIESGQAEAGIRAILAQPGLDLRGIHAHIGSMIEHIEPYRASLRRLIGLARETARTTGFELHEISPGGGYGVRYTADDGPVDALGLIGAVAEAVAEAVADPATHDGSTAPLPTLTIEPGRAMIATSAVALYRVGSVKELPGLRTYVAVDGGMADNIRPTAYGARYSAVIADRVRATADRVVAIAGRYCETGDILVQEVRLARPAVGDLIALPVAGAYQLSMASNYNLVPRPAVVVVADGVARLVRRRETYDDLMAPEAWTPDRT
jgi:diaminopimelate decarboxylase